MNIVKLKDIILTPEDGGLTQEQCDLFNGKFRGKYVHCIDWSYVIPIEEMTESDAINVSRRLVDETTIYSESASIMELSASDVRDILNQWSWLPYDKLMDYVDTEITSKINDVDKYRVFNSFIAEDITLDQLKKFRTWLASTLLTFDIQDSKVNHMLFYYANGMYDATVESLTEFGTAATTDILNTMNTSTCGCTSGATVIQPGNFGICDPLSIYRQNVYRYMISVFSQIDFWTDFDPDFLKMFKLYIDGILQHNLPLQSDEYTTHFVDCTCQLKGNTSQEINRQILIRLSKSLQYMIDDDVKGNKKYITTSFNDWATHLYEKMEW